MKTQTYFSRGWYWDGTAEIIQFYNGVLVAKFIVKMKRGYRFEDYC